MPKQSKGFKEEFAKFFEAPDRVKFKELLKNNTGEYNHIDFKEAWLDTEKTAKHILGFANSRGGIIVFGVKENSDKTLTSQGLPELKDKTQIVQSLQSYLPEKLVFDILDFAYADSEYAEIKNKKFQVLIVEDTPPYIPFLSMRDGTGIIKNRIYYRGAINTEEATQEQLQEIINRRIETGYSSTSEDEFKNHLAQLKDLYAAIPRYVHFFDKFAMMGMTSNPLYPEESFEEFILNMIEKKKVVIQRFINNHGG